MMGLSFLPSSLLALSNSGIPAGVATTRVATRRWDGPGVEMGQPGTVMTARHEPSIDRMDKTHAWGGDCDLDSRGKVMLKSLLFSETEELMERIGEKRGRAEVLAGWLYHDRRLIQDIAETAGNGGGGDRISKSVNAKSRMGRKTRDAIRAIATADGGIVLEDVQLAADGTRKLVSVLTSGEGAGKKVETVIIPMLRGPQREPRYTICVSSQVGCAMNCQFCYTGRLGLMANLQAAQIVEQVLVAKRFLESVGDPFPVTGVVFMGMGEPFDNYERVMRAVKILTDPRAGVRLKASSVTVSTVGLVPQIERFCEDDDNGASLAISLHAVKDEMRDKLIPVNRRYPLAKLAETLRRYFPKTSRPEPHDIEGISPDRPDNDCTQQSAAPSAQPPTTPANTLEAKVGKETGSEGACGEFVPEAARVEPKPGATEPSGSDLGTGLPISTRAVAKPQKRRRKSRILAVEYTLLEGVNDSIEDAHRLAGWLRGISCVVNLITFNAHDGTPFSSTSPRTSEAFRQALMARGQLCTFRDSRGDDGMAACGQLGGESMEGNGHQPRRPVPVAWGPSSMPRVSGVEAPS